MPTTNTYYKPCESVLNDLTEATEQARDMIAHYIYMAPNTGDTCGYIIKHTILSIYSILYYLEEENAVSFEFYNWDFSLKTFQIDKIYVTKLGEELIDTWLKILNNIESQNVYEQYVFR